MYDTPAADPEALPVTRVIAALAEQSTDPSAWSVPAPREAEPQPIAEQPVDLRSIYREFHDLAADAGDTPGAPRGYQTG